VLRNERVFRWALETIGFKVMPLSGAVMRDRRGSPANGNHLVLSIELDEPYLADVGLGDGPIEPLPIREGTYVQEWRSLRLERLPEGWWRFHNSKNAFAPTFDFQLQPADWGVLRQQCDRLQTSAESRFVQNAVCIRHLPNSTVALIGRVLKTVEEHGATTRLLHSSQEYSATLAAVFGLRIQEATGLWQRICDRHEALFGGAD